jgi:hypothetical protein
MTDKTTSSDKTDRYDKSAPVFRLKPINRSNQAIIKYVGFLSDGEKLGDEIIELDRPMHPEFTIYGKHAIPIKKIGNFEMLGRIYRCNIVGTHIVVSRRYPLLYLTVQYERPMVNGSLFQLFVSIDIDKDQKEKVKEHKKYVDLQFSGTWYQHIDCDDELVQNYDRYLMEMLENEATEKFYKSDDPLIVEQRNRLTDEEVVEWIDRYVENEKVFYDSLMKEHKIEFQTIEKARDHFIKLCTSDRFYKFLQIAVRCRELHRRKEYKIDETTDYVVPKNVTKLDEIKKSMIENNELILNEES